MTGFLSLDFVYTPTHDIDGAISQHVEGFGADLEWKVRAMDTVVACLRVSDAGPRILLSEHVEGELPILVYRVESYRDVLEPAVDAMIAKHGALRAVIVLGPEWKGMTAGAVWEDLRIGLGKITKRKRCAVVTDRDWIEHATKAFAWIKPVDIKVFGLDQVDDAMAWAAADS